MNIKKPEPVALLPLFLMMTWGCLTTEKTEAQITWYVWASSEGGNDHSYGVSTTTGDWSTVEAEAVALGANLVSIGGAAEQALR